MFLCFFLTKKFFKYVSILEACACMCVKLKAWHNKKYLPLLYVILFYFSPD